MWKVRFLFYVMIHWKGFCSVLSWKEAAAQSWSQQTNVGVNAEPNMAMDKARMAERGLHESPFRDRRQMHVGQPHPRRHPGTRTHRGPHVSQHTCSLPIATRQYLLVCPGSASSSGIVTPQKDRKREQGSPASKDWVTGGPQRWRPRTLFRANGDTLHHNLPEQTSDPHQIAL